ncbi:hypothetical protein PSEHALCIP103_00394 [Pseudoalteromonas haloplanktis]|uniref:Polysaccharide biosynthesis protein CapD-like domain-containing protein n=1 Tax=Pseudoalteromonas haloplanktis TaxID=228 RepID=A0A9W4QSM1_PSEHA|nr:UDP-N-acetylglucosamine 4,6-dehydratase [Pseudoalteromonas haloplanktis]CAH9051393.1 hypothetical protein PSEHALCIP103_00394 [Pseudoalteromonas haloplanktis]
MDILKLVNRDESLFSNDLTRLEPLLCNSIENASFLVLGGAGTIGQAVVKELFKRQPKKLHVIDISENNLVELVRDIRSTLGYMNGDFQTYTLDIGSLEYDAFFASDGKYDYVLNLSALKHVRNEKDQFTLMRMVTTNILNTEKTLQQCINNDVKKYFCVSTDKAANPVNMMGASKRIMEMFLMRASNQIPVSMARFANVAFSDGSLLYSFKQRLDKHQPIVAPSDVKRYFVTPQESGLLCIFSCIFGDNRDIYFPKLNDQLHLLTFSEIAESFLKQKNYEPYLCNSEDEARALVKTLPSAGKWPCLFTLSDTSGEKPSEEFFTEDEVLDMLKFESLGIIKNEASFNKLLLQEFEEEIYKLRQSGSWQKEQIIKLFFTVLPDFAHQETGKYLESKM